MAKTSADEYYLCVGYTTILLSDNELKMHCVNTSPTAHIVIIISVYRKAAGQTG